MEGFARCLHRLAVIRIEPVGRLSCNAMRSWIGSNSVLVAWLGHQHRDLTGDDNDIDSGDISSDRQHVCQRKHHMKLDESTLQATAYPPDHGPVLNQWWRLLRLEVGRLIPSLCSSCLLLPNKADRLQSLHPIL